GVSENSGRAMAKSSPPVYTAAKRRLREKPQKVCKITNTATRNLYGRSTNCTAEIGRVVGRLRQAAQPNHRRAWHKRLYKFSLLRGVNRPHRLRLRCPMLVLSTSATATHRSHGGQNGESG